MAKEIYEPTPPGILQHIAEFVSPAHCAMLDPWAGDGQDLEYLSRRWHCSRYGVETDAKLYQQLEKLTKALHEDFFGCYVRNFQLIYVKLPTDISNPVAWINEIHQASAERAIIIWRLPKRVVLMPSAIKALVTHFDNIEAFKDPPHAYEHLKMFTIRCTAKEKITFSIQEAQSFAETIEHAPTLGTIYIKPWDTPRYPKGTRHFKIRGLEWEDVFPDIAQIWSRITVPMSNKVFNWSTISTKYLSSLSENIANPKIPDPSIVDGPPGIQVWCDAYAVADGGIYMLSMSGRKNAIRAVEAWLKNSKTVKLGYYRHKLIGGGSNWQKNYRVLTTRLTNSGAYLSIWIHNNATCRPDAKATSNLFIPEDNVIAANMISRMTGFPVAPEWMEYVKGYYVRKSSIQNLKGKFIQIPRHRLEELLIPLAKRGELETPEFRPPEVIRPIMPPSVGIWGQFVTQEFINEIPMGNRIIMHAEPIEIPDVDQEITPDGKKETIEVIRKDCARITVFHFAGQEAGEVEIYETAKYNEEKDDDD